MGDKPKDDKHKKHYGQHEDCFVCKMQTIGFNREGIRAVPKGR